MATIVEEMGISGLTSRYGLNQGLQGPLAPDQWQLDVQHWFTIWLATLQGSLVMQATGPSNPDVMPWVQTPRDETEKHFCQSQKMVSTAYTNFNTFGLCLTFVVGTIIIVLSHTIEPLASCIQKRRRLDTYSRLEWSLNENLQLQRLAHEELGVGTWHNGAETILFTDSGERLATVDLADPNHPRLKAPPPHFDQLLARGGDEKDKPSSEGGLGSEQNVASPAKADAGVHVGKAPDTFFSESAEQHVSTEQLPSAEELAHVERQTGDPEVTADRNI
ncbi:hypothetical protein DIS24_g10867 [Lasiodiplodia hormozganensis]|uniref:Uncharacterized protein n=1 Tax=Lasiodiplodia hormozganensis TaxID=869390 RepID=A0AA39X669_9PEZI|nr:hypothetical protein DIS24_g10867 [Lasiodiplodia hormozganensis]